MLRKYFQNELNNSVVQNLCCRKLSFDRPCCIVSQDTYSRKPSLGALKVASVLGRLLGKIVEQRWHQASVPSTGERKQTMAISLSGSVSVIQPYSSSLFLATGIFPGSRGEISTLCAWMACTFTLQHYIQHIHCRLAEFRQQQASNYCATLVKKNFHATCGTEPPTSSLSTAL